MNKTLKAVIFATASLSLLVTITMMAANARPAAAKVDEKIKIRAVTSFTGDDPWKSSWETVIRDYVKMNPKIEIVNEATPTQGEALRTKLKTDFASGNEPDVAFFFNGIDTKPLLESGKLYTWDAELKKDVAWAKNFAPASLKAVAFERRIYALPYIGYYEGLLINKDLFKKYKVKIPTDFIELKTAIAVFNKNRIIPIANSFVDPRYLLEFAILSAGGPAGHAKAFDPSWEKGLNAIKDLYALNAFPKDSMTLTDEQAQQLFKDKKAAMIVNGSWVVGGVKDTKNTAVTYFPCINKPKGNYRDIIAGCGSGWYMSKDLNNQKNGAPLAFIKYLTSPAVMARFAAAGGVPQIKTTIPTASVATKSGWAMLNGSSSLNSPIDSYLNPDAFNTMNRGVAYIVTEKKTAAQVLAEARKLNKR